ncbi:MAG: PilW family protein [Pseudomonadota bacterium]
MNHAPSRRSPRNEHQHGLTMVELLVALTLSSLIALAAIAALTVARTGFTSVDAASQLRDNSRFASDLIQRLAMQAGFQDVVHATATKVGEIQVKVNIDSPVQPFVMGINNAILQTSLLNSTNDPFASSVDRTAANGGCTSTSDTACINGSDILILRYQSGGTNPNATTTDSTMIDCQGNPETTPPENRADQITSVFHVARSSAGEPALMCATRSSSTGTWTSQPVIQGVETFQVLYGVSGASGATAGTALPALSTSSALYSNNSIADRYFRADELKVTAGGSVTAAAASAATLDNFRRVRSLRIGLLMKAAGTTAQDQVSQEFYPLGKLRDRSAETRPAENGHSFLFTDRSTAASPSTFSFPQDGRVRQTLTFTVYLRNVQLQ